MLTGTSEGEIIPIPTVGAGRKRRSSSCTTDFLQLVMCMCCDRQECDRQEGLIHSSQKRH